MVGCEKQAPRIDIKDVQLCAADDLTMAVPFYDTGCAIGGIVAKAFGFPYHVACQFVESGHADFFPTGGHNNLVAINQWVFTDSLVVGS